jgi:methionyl-tRNA synthetase
MVPGFTSGFFTSLLLVVIIVWSIVWKGLALWKSARRDNKIWFIVFLVINTIGILEILYLFVFSKKSGSQTAASTPTKTT